MNGEALIILHVEDNPDHSNLIIRTLRKHRVANQVFLVEDGEAALDFLLRRGQYADSAKSPRPHLVLLDLRIPKVDGQEVLRVIKTTEELLAIPVVVLTSSETEKDITEAYEHHANSYLVKPVGFEAFTEMMECLGFYWLGWNLHPWECHVRGNNE
ncbi:MAG: response regulator [Candidatus Nealsonbacteria bacterium]|nr:response regulator [Candidatus Nealsonbacteria bacterium]